LDLGLVTAAVTENNDLGGFFINGLVGNDNFIVNTINGNILTTNAVISTTGNITAGNLISNGQGIVTYTPATATGVAVTVSAANTQGGTGYADFLRGTNTSSSATNGSKTFRITSTGGLEIVNSAYDAVILSLTNAGKQSTVQLSRPIPVQVQHRPSHRVANRRFYLELKNMIPTVTLPVQHLHPRLKDTINLVRLLELMAARAPANV
jgi:hypothetical protein